MVVLEGGGFGIVSELHRYRLLSDGFPTTSEPRQPADAQIWRPPWMKRLPISPARRSAAQAARSRRGYAGTKLRLYACDPHWVKRLTDTKARGATPCIWHAPNEIPDDPSGCRRH